MSAFMVVHNTIDKILSAFERTPNKDLRKALCAVLEVEDTGADAEFLTILGDEMLRLNSIALKARYNDESDPGDYKFMYVQCTQIESYKSLRCWLYQCSEGEVPEMKLFQIMGYQAAAHIAEAIITGLPKYDEAPWE